ncbi:hypothetical protein PCH_Pc13g12260 [Penicillium rubens Wisconsin 54-1255]|uniref:Uncharacterized protein n=1 Tax=Penicillium rubens (strain ATCC 28089 / DSM 1075 / NRRL 1951 / Wisconsin 54-1255) TaxID=500485 RepID=B6H5A0_PENRW|nr:hypothetical protein PCH_Pc13g12260 [Penicillium rubens Wisconsin 54-1255]
MNRPWKQAANYLYSTTTRFQVRTPSVSSSHICWIDSLHFCTSASARTPLLGRRLVWDKGCRISQAERAPEADGMSSPFSMVDWSQKSCSFCLKSDEGMDLTGQMGVSLFDSVHDGGMDGWIASTTREEETASPVRWGKQLDLRPRVWGRQSRPGLEGILASQRYLCRVGTMSGLGGDEARWN